MKTARTAALALAAALLAAGCASDPSRSDMVRTLEASNAAAQEAIDAARARVKALEDANAALNLQLATERQKHADESAALNAKLAAGEDRLRRALALCGTACE